MGQPHRREIAEGRGCLEPDASACVHSGSARRGARPASGIEEVTFNDLRGTAVAAPALPLTMLTLMVRTTVADLSAQRRADE
jgi:hypothetical protein